MFLHIGNDVSVFIKDVIAVLDMETATTMRESREFLKMCEEEDFLYTVAPGEMPKSIIITEENGRSIVYISPIAASTIRKRSSLYERN